MFDEAGDFELLVDLRDGLRQIVLLAGLACEELLCEVLVARSCRHMPDFFALKRRLALGRLDATFGHILLELFDALLLADVLLFDLLKMLLDRAGNDVNLATLPEFGGVS